MAASATNALLSGPNDIAVDGAGNLYIADSFNGLIRQVEASSGNITVVAAAGLHNPTGVAVDAADNLYIADTGNSVIRRVDASSGKVTIVAGNGGYGYGGDQGPAISAKLGSPVCVRLDPAGNLYIADQGDNVVRQVNAESGIITTIAGTGAPGYFGYGGIPTAAALRNPTGVALDSAGNIYIADYANNLIRKISPASTLAFPNTLVGEASAPQQLTVLNLGNQPLSLSGLASQFKFRSRAYRRRDLLVFFSFSECRKLYSRHRLLSHAQWKSEWKTHTDEQQPQRRGNDAIHGLDGNRYCWSSSTVVVESLDFDLCGSGSRNIQQRTIHHSFESRNRGAQYFQHSVGRRE